MKTDERASEEGLHIKYVGRDAYWVDGVVLFAASAIALVAACWAVAAGVSAATVSRTMVWLSLPWFVALYFLSRKLRKVVEAGFEIVLSFGVVPAYAVSLVILVVTFVQLANKIF
jgi:hypothetical protein